MLAHVGSVCAPGLDRGGGVDWFDSLDLSSLNHTGAGWAKLSPEGSKSSNPFEVLHVTTRCEMRRHATWGVYDDVRGLFDPCILVQTLMSKCDRLNPNSLR